jgi:5-methylcytosine-specific restriction endonuclease McrA
MKNHTKIYLKEMNYHETDWIPCEMCGQTAVDIHHIDSRGMGGSKEKDFIENLMALCRSCHNRYGDIKEEKAMLRITHLVKLNQRKCK